jgi:hypothetical protein
LRGNGVSRNCQTVERFSNVGRMAENLFEMWRTIFTSRAREIRSRDLLKVSPYLRVDMRIGKAGWSKNTGKAWPFASFEIGIVLSFGHWPWTVEFRRWGPQRSLFVGPLHVWILPPHKLGSNKSVGNL